MTRHKKYIYANAIESTPFLMFDCVSFQARPWPLRPLRPLRSSLLFCLTPGKADNKALVPPSLVLMRNSNKCQATHRESTPTPPHLFTTMKFQAGHSFPLSQVIFGPFGCYPALPEKPHSLFVWYHRSQHLNQIWGNGSDLNSKAQGRWGGGGVRKDILR